VKHTRLHSLICGFCSMTMFSTAAAVDYPLSCGYMPRSDKKNPEPELSAFESCAKQVGESDFEIAPAHLQKIDFGPQGLAVIYLQKMVFYIRRDGKLGRTHFFDNGADGFSSGLVRTIRHGKFGFMDTQLQTVIPARYDFAFPFAGAYAKVCLGCRIERHGEHGLVVGGKWGYIDRQGKAVVSITYSKAQLPPPGE